MALYFVLRGIDEVITAKPKNCCKNKLERSTGPSGSVKKDFNPLFLLTFRSRAP